MESLREALVTTTSEGSRLEFYRSLPVGAQIVKVINFVGAMMREASSHGTVANQLFGHRLCCELEGEFGDIVRVDSAVKGGDGVPESLHLGVLFGEFAVVDFDLLLGKALCDDNTWVGVHSIDENGQLVPSNVDALRDDAKLNCELEWVPTHRD